MAEIPLIGHDFEHEPLDLTRQSIRVFQILPGTGTVRCLMKHVEMDSERTAVSYVWGDEEPSQVILINERPFYVRDNLHNFLIQMRNDEFLKPLWVDALCIDQANTSERNHQVQQMGSIYRDANAMISWLGQGNASAAQFMQIAIVLLKKVAEERAARLGTGKKIDTGDLLYLVMTRLRSGVDESHGSWEGFRNSLEIFSFNEYFTRTWIVQEVFLAKRAHTAVYGDMNIPWIDLKDVVLAYMKQPEGSRGTLSRSPLFPFIQPAIYDPHRTESSSILALITQFAKTKCSDPRDHVFALQSLWDSGKFPIRVDYNLSSFSLFIKLASQLLTSAIQPMSSIITLIDALALDPEDFANAGELNDTEASIPITLSAAWYCEIDMRELSEYRKSLLGAGEHWSSERTPANDLHFCACKHCICLHDLPDTTIFRECILRTSDLDLMTISRLAPLHLVQILGSKAYWGIVGGDLCHSGTSLWITPASINNASDCPRLEEIHGNQAVILSLRNLCGLLNHLSCDEIRTNRGLLMKGERCWGIDYRKHFHGHSDRNASSNSPHLVRAMELSFGAT